MKKTNKLPVRRFSTSTVVAICAVLLFGVVGTTLLVRSKAATCTSNVYSQGVNGSVCVKYIQQLVNYQTGHYYNAPLKVDGNYGTKTKNAVVYVQKTFGLKQDGVVGPKTWALICSPNMGPGIPPSFPLAAARSAGCRI